MKNASRGRRAQESSTGRMYNTAKEPKRCPLVEKRCPSAENPCPQPQNVPGTELVCSGIQTEKVLDPREGENVCGSRKIRQELLKVTSHEGAEAYENILPNARHRRQNSYNATRQPLWFVMCPPRFKQPHVRRPSLVRRYSSPSQ